MKAPSFTSREARAVGVSSATLAHYIAKGDVERISRGVYRSKNAPEIQDFRWEDLIFAARAVKDGVVCLISALAIYDLTEEIPRQQGWTPGQNCSDEKRRPWAIGDGAEWGDSSYIRSRKNGC
jgi:predicted transcriptional regulator of viral defense system